ncbi:MAG: hypothetical protein ACLQBD_24525, partial [Syntrophobacteraceae bacterium]
LWEPIAPALDARTILLSKNRDISNDHAMDCGMREGGVHRTLTYNWIISVITLVAILLGFFCEASRDKAFLS